MNAQVAFKVAEGWRCWRCKEIVAKDVEDGLAAVSCPSCGSWNAIERQTVYPSEFKKDRDED